MKKIIIPIICIALIVSCAIYNNKISSFVANQITQNGKVYLAATNGYEKDEGFMYVDVTDNYEPYSYQDLLNIIYSVINNGWDNFTFYCPNEYSSCVEDIKTILNNDPNNIVPTNINNFVHPYNSFYNISTAIYDSGEVILTISYIYTKEQIAKIDEEINRIIKENTSSENNAYDNLNALHDYIINNTKYDVSEEKDEDNKYPRNNAYSALFEHLTKCNGYTDVMAIMLDKLGYKNYKIATTPDNNTNSDGHIWNAVFYDNKWLHIDLTWDDPVSSSGKDYLYHKYFLVDTKGLNEADAGEVDLDVHNFNPTIYLEFNESIKEIMSK